MPEPATRAITEPQHLIELGGTMIELGAACVVMFHAAWAMAVLVRSRDSDRARTIIADGVVAALSFSVAGTLLKTIGLDSWVQIRTFAFVLALRTLLKQVFVREQRRIAGRRAAAAGG